MRHLLPRKKEQASDRPAAGPSALRAPSPAGGGRQSGDAAVKPLSRLRERGWGEGTAAGSRPGKPSCKSRRRHTSTVTRSTPARSSGAMRHLLPRKKEQASDRPAAGPHPPSGHLPPQAGEGSPPVAAVKPLSRRLRERGWGEGTAADSRPGKPSCKPRERHTSAGTRSPPARSSGAVRHLLPGRTDKPPLRRHLFRALRNDTG